MQSVIVIPARYASTRLANKLLLADTGMPLIQHTYLKAKQSKLAQRVMIATDDARIAEVVNHFGAEVVITDPHHPTGTDRLAEVANKYLQDADLIINIQADEPECNPHHIDMLINLYQASIKSNQMNASSDKMNACQMNASSDKMNACVMATLVCRFPMDNNDGPGSVYDPNCVKALLGQPIMDPHFDQHSALHANRILGYEALYFSRSVIPFPRESNGKIVNSQDYYMHCGVYAYSPQLLQRYVSLPQGHAEKIEKLEQLRLLENGYKIVAGVVECATPGIDTQADYDAFVKRYQHQSQVELV